MKLRVLVADDEPWAIEMLTAATDRLGLELHVARNGIDAVDQFKELAPSVVILDALLSKLDGLQVAARLRETEFGRMTPIVVTSSMHRRGTKVDELQRRYGFNEFLEKPYDLADLTALLERLVDDDEEAVASPVELAAEGLPPEPAVVPERPLEDMGVPALLAEICRGRRTGTLTVRSGEICRRAWFSGGILTHAWSNDRRDRLVRILLRQRKLSPKDGAQALPLATREHLALGAALVKIGLISEADLEAARSVQVLGSVFRLFTSKVVSWSFAAAKELDPACQSFRIPTANILFWGLRQLEGRQSFAPWLPGPRTVLDHPAECIPLKESLHLTYFEEQLLGLVDGKKRLAEILSTGRITHLDVARVMVSLLLVGVVRIASSGESIEQLGIGELGLEELPFDLNGRLDMISPARLLGRTWLAGLSGKLTVRTESLVTEVSFERGEIVSARSNQPEFLLGNVLLRAGKVTPEDHTKALEELTRRPAAKIGSLLLELRAVSLEELHMALRFQVQLVVLDLFRWNHGDYEIVAGEPSAEVLVTLEATTPNLILEGARSGFLPEGIAQRLRDPSILITKVWSDDRIAALLSLSTAERRLLTLLETPRIANELASLGMMGEAELGRSLHGLLAVEALRANRFQPDERTATAARTAVKIGRATAGPPEIEIPPAIRLDGELTGRMRFAVAPAGVAEGAGRAPEVWSALEAENRALRDEVAGLREELATLQATLPPADRPRT